MTSDVDLGLLSPTFLSARSYLLNPVTLARAAIRGEYEHSVGEARATFETDGILQTASLLHTLRKERRIIQDLVASLEADDTFYDLGANLGVFSCIAGSVLPEGQVVAFEPHPENATRLRHNASLVNTNVSVYECALSNTDGTAELTVGASNQRHSLVNDDASNTVEVSTCRGDSVVESHGNPPTVIKIDVEGAEVDVLRGMETVLANRSCRLVYCEVHPERLADRGITAATVSTILSDAGYAVEVMETVGSERYLRARRVT